MISNAYRRRGFTLIELMVVLGIIAILSTSLIIALRNRDRNAKIEQCAANIQEIATAMENFKANDGEYIHSGTYNYYEGSANSVKTVTLNFGTAETSKTFYNSADDVNLSKLIEKGDVKIFKGFKNLPVQCPADPTTRSASSTSYKVVLNPYNYTVYCTCGASHRVGDGYPRFVHGTGKDGIITPVNSLETGI